MSKESITVYIKIYCRALQLNINILILLCASSELDCAPKFYYLIVLMQL